MSIAKDMTMARRCEVCNQTARVRVLRGYVLGEPRFSQFCLACADAAERFRPQRAPHTRPHLAAPVLLLFCGLLLASFGALADQIGASGARGFGAYQTVGVVLAAGCLVIGALLAIELLAVFGLLVFVIAAGADVLDLGAGQGWYGWKQELAIVAGLSACAVGLAWRWFTRSAAAAASAHGRQG